jgi:hypothetical protein
LIRKGFLVLKDYLKGYHKMSSQSEAACRIWASIIGRWPVSFSKNRWWSVFDVVLHIASASRADLQNFHRTALHQEVSKKNVERMRAAAGDAKSKFDAEVEALLFLGKEFRDATLLLEGDGFCLPFVENILRTLNEKLSLLKRERQHHAFVQKQWRDLQAKQAPLSTAQAHVSTFLGVVDALSEHFERAILREMAPVLPLYRAAAFFHPVMFKRLRSKQGFGQDFNDAVRLLSSFKGMPSYDTLSLGVHQELPAYTNACEGQSAHLALYPEQDTPTYLWDWWKSLRTQVPHFWSIASILVLMQPSSAFIERFFSVLKGNTSALQSSEAPETIQGRSMACTIDKKLTLRLEKP